MRLSTAVSCSLAVLVSGCAAPEKPAIQPPHTAPKIRVERVEEGHSCGWCTDPTESKTIIDATSIKILDQPFIYTLAEKPQPGTKYSITKQDWEDLERVILDPKVLIGFTGSIDCPGCAEQPPVEWVTVQFSDGSKKFVEYSPAHVPAPIAGLVNKIGTIRLNAMLQQKPRRSP